MLMDGIVGPEPLLPNLSARSPLNPYGTMKGEPGKSPAPISVEMWVEHPSYGGPSHASSSAFKLLNGSLSCWGDSISGGWKREKMSVIMSFVDALRSRDESQNWKG